MPNLRDVKVGMNVVDLNHKHVGFVERLIPGGFIVQTEDHAIRLNGDVIFGVDGGVQLICAIGNVGAYEIE